MTIVEEIKEIKEIKEKKEEKKDDKDDYFNKDIGIDQIASRREREP